MADRFLIVGLGNPGREYEKTRHNIGFRIVDALAAANGFAFSKQQSRAMIADGVIAGERVLLVKPLTYMNLSGEAVGSLVNFYKVPLTHLLVTHDDMDIPLGTLRIRKSGSAGGQNGVKSIISHVGTQEFARMRFGIGRPPGRMDPAAYVLQDFDRSESDLLHETMDRALKAVEVFLKEGIEPMMNRFNGTGEAPKPAANPRPAAKPARSAASLPVNESSNESST